MFLTSETSLAAWGPTIVNDNRVDRLRSDQVEQAVAEQDAKRFAREEQDKLDSQ